MKRKCSIFPSAAVCEILKDYDWASAGIWAFVVHMDRIRISIYLITYVCAVTDNFDSQAASLHGLGDEAKDAVCR